MRRQRRRTGGVSLGTALSAGLGIWLRDVGGYFSYAALLTTWQRALLGLAALGFVVAWVVSRRHRRAVVDTNASVRAAQPVASTRPPSRRRFGAPRRAARPSRPASIAELEAELTASATRKVPTVIEIKAGSTLAQALTA